MKRLAKKAEFFEQGGVAGGVLIVRFHPGGFVERDNSRADLQEPLAALECPPRLDRSAQPRTLAAAQAHHGDAEDVCANPAPDLAIAAAAGETDLRRLDAQFAEPR